MGQCASTNPVSVGEEITRNSIIKNEGTIINQPSIPLPSIPNRLPMVPEEWSTWGLDDLSLWARKSVRESHVDCPTAIAILYLSEADGSAAMHLVHEALGVGDTTDGADLKLKHGKPKFAELMKGKWNFWLGEYFLVYLYIY